MAAAAPAANVGVAIVVGSGAVVRAVAKFATDSDGDWAPPISMTGLVFFASSLTTFY